MRTPEGEYLGEHIGLAFYTLGQRKGIGLGGKKGLLHENGSTHRPWFVAAKDIATNTLYVVRGREHSWLLSPQLDAIDVSWIAEHAPAASRYTAKTRYRQADAACELSFTDDGFELNFDEHQWAVTPGQSAVLYDDEICLGGAIITRAHTLHTTRQETLSIAR